MPCDFKSIQLGKDLEEICRLLPIIIAMYSLGLNSQGHNLKRSRYGEDNNDQEKKRSSEQRGKL